jgi:hypothetical protein
VKTYRQYLLIGLRHSNATLIVLAEKFGKDSDRYKNALQYNRYLRASIKNGIPSDCVQSISVPKELSVDDVDNLF